MLGQSSFQHPSNQSDWQRSDCRETDGPFAGTVGLEFVFVDFEGIGTGIERAVIRSRSESHKQFSIQPECGDTIIDAFLRSRYCCSDGSSKLFQCQALFAAHNFEKLVDDYGFHGMLYLNWNS
jgi:hypothetical protein